MNRLRRHAPPLLVLLAWALLLAAWVMGNAPFGAPDEAFHYIRAVGVSEGHLLGTPDPAARIGVTPTQVAWTAQATRQLSLPRALDPQPYTCEIGRPHRSAACQLRATPNTGPVARATTVGNYQPLPYLLPAAVVRAGGSATAALRLARAIQALSALALLAIAVFALYDGASPLLSLLGPLLAVTPMAIFCASALGGSGIEVASGVAFMACLLRVGRSAAEPRRWWLLLASSGAVLALSRSTGPAFLVLMLALAAALAGPRAFAARLLAGWPARLAVCALLAAIALNRVWEGLYGPSVPLDTSSLHAGLVAGAHQWWKALPQLVGSFGYLEVKLPLILPLAWFALALALLAAAAAVSERRERLVLAGALAAGLAGPAVFYALFVRPSGFGLQGRYVLPALVALPIVAGELLCRHSRRASSAWLGRLALALPLAVALAQILAWYVNARRYAVGTSGPTWFLPHASWAPPGGWWPWLALALAAGGCLAAAVFARPGRGPAPLARSV